MCDNEKKGRMKVTTSNENYCQNFQSGEIIFPSKEVSEVHREEVVWSYWPEYFLHHTFIRPPVARFRIFLNWSLGRRAKNKTKNNVSVDRMRFHLVGFQEELNP